MALGKTENGTASTLGVKDMGIAAGAQYLVRVVARGERIKVFVNDTNTALIDVSDAAFDGGLIGLRAYQSAATFDDVYARGLLDSSATVGMSGVPARSPGARPRRLRRNGSWNFSVPTDADSPPRLYDARARRL